MKLLVINWRDCKHPRAGGAETHIHSILSRLATSYGHEILFLANSSGGEIPATEEYDGVTFQRFGNEYNFNFLVPGRLKKAIRQFRPDLVIEDVNKLPFFSPKYIETPVLLVVPHLFSEAIYQETNFVFATYVYLAERLMIYTYRQCHIHVISDSTRDDLASKGYRREDISVAECGVDHAIYSPGGRKSDRFTICYTGRIRKYKSVDHLIRAAEKVLKVVPDARFVIIGDGDYLSELKKLTRRLGLDKSIEFPGFISQEAKVELLRSSHCLVYPSIKEGWGISNIEANACGTPVVAADVPGLRDSVDKGVSGLLYPYGNTDELADKIISVLTDEKLRISLEKGAVKWAGRFTWDNTALKFNDMLKSRYNDLYN